jgi:UDP-glucose 4-epimerase
MTVAIIGSNGYIGKHLAKYLLEKNCEVYGYDVSNESKVDGVKYSCIKFLTREDTNALNLDVDFIFYFAGITGTAKAYDDYELYIDTNEKTLLYMLDKMRTENYKGRIIFPSTRLVYKGEKDIPLKEDALKEFKTIYALNKWFGENVIGQYHDYFGINYNIFRICVPYGNLFSDNYSYGTIGFFLNSAIKNKKITLFGDGDQKRTFTHVEDICNQIYYSIIDEKSINQIYNISGENFSLFEVANKIASKYNAQVEHKEWPELDRKMESGDTIFNGTKLLSNFNVQQIHYFNTWLHNTVFM